MNPPQLDALLLIVGGLGLFSLAVFGNLLAKIHRQGGRVDASLFGFPELLVTLVLGGFFALSMGRMLWADTDAPPAKVNIDQILPQIALAVVVVMGLSWFLSYRGIDPVKALGLVRLPLSRVLLLGLGLVLAAFPLVTAASICVQLLLQHNAQEQELVTLFKEVAQAGDDSALAQIFVAGAIVAPLSEEFLFRGFFYAVGKRYLGALSSALLTSALFAAIHLNLTALPGLFLLALCLTIAYEATGSLLVPVTMHALFNGTQLLFLYLLSQSPVPA